MAYCAIALFLCQILVISEGALQFINREGAYRTNQLNKYISTSDVSDSNIESLVKVVDCTSTDAGAASINKIFGTNFNNAEKGVSVETSDNGLILFSSFDSITSLSFCGSKAVDYCNALPGSICLVFKSSDIYSALLGYDQIFRRLLAHSKELIVSGGSPLKVTILIEMKDEDAGMQDTVTSAVVAHMKSIWMEADAEESFARAVDMQILATENADKAAVQASAKTATPFGIQSLADAWTKVDVDEEPRVLLSPAQREAVFKIEEAYALGLANADAIIGQWQQRVSSGNIVGKFAKRVGQLITSVKQEFASHVGGGLLGLQMVQERMEHLLMLRNHIDSAVLTLFRQQLEIVEGTVTKSFRKDLLKVLAEFEDGELLEGEQAQREQQVLREGLFEFRTLTIDLENDNELPPSLAKIFEVETQKKVAELSDILEAIAKEFPESPAAKLEELKRMDRAAKQTRPADKSKRGRRMPKLSNLVFNLVGMLRPPGYGNLQGFIGYATSLANFPLEILLGVQNDGDSPEIMGEDREYPILRLQPKVNFDIDL